jgi:F-type H+-transporting ATPase subunit epsilon
MAETFQLEIVTPDKQVVNDVAEEAQIPAKGGYIGILPGHAPLISELGVGEISYRKGSETKRLAVAWGFAEVLPTKVTILAETAERAEEIDVTRAQKSKEQAAQVLQSTPAGSDDNKRADAEAALERASARLEVAGKK